MDPPGGVVQPPEIDGARSAERHHAATEAGAGHPGTEDPGNRLEPSHEPVELRGGDLEVAGQAPVALGHEPTGGNEVVGLERGGEGQDPSTLGDDVSRPPLQQRIGEGGQVRRPGQAQGTDQGGGGLALGHTRGIRRRPHGAPLPRLGHHDVEIRWHRHLAARQRGEVDEEGVPGGGARAHQRVHGTDRCTDEMFGLLAVAGDLLRTSGTVEDLGQGDGQGCARGQARPRRQGGGDLQAAAGGRPRRGDHGGHEAGPRRLDRIDCPGVGVHSDREADPAAEGVRRHGQMITTVRCERHGHAEVDGHGQRQAPVVVGVVADEIDAARPCGCPCRWHPHPPCGRAPSVRSEATPSGRTDRGWSCI